MVDLEPKTKQRRETLLIPIFPRLVLYQIVTCILRVCFVVKRRHCIFSVSFA